MHGVLAAIPAAHALTNDFCGGHCYRPGCAEHWVCSNATLHADKIICMGLPKTGTTATAVALRDVGLRVAHNQGDRLGRCNVIINTMEAHYEELARKHPTAKWLITYNENATQWLESVGAHLIRSPCPRDGQLGCNFHGCQMGLPEGVRRRFPCAALTAAARAARGLLQRDGSASPSGVDVGADLVAAYKLYYERLFRFLEGRPYALVDVRAGRYENLALVHERLKGPFAAKNTKEHPGEWPRCG